jgi:hypothetical protein
MTQSSTGGRCSGAPSGKGGGGDGDVFEAGAQMDGGLGEPSVDRETARGVMSEDEGDERGRRRVGDFADGHRSPRTNHGRRLSRA